MQEALPAEIWNVVVAFSPDAATFRALALTCNGFALSARAEKMQEAMKRRFAREVEKKARNEIREFCFVLPNGTKHGMGTVLFENRKKAREGVYRDGKREGTWAWWWRNGQKCEEAEYQDDKLEGTWTKWDESGHKSEEAEYRDGKLDGKTTTWFDNGQKGGKRRTETARRMERGRTGTRTDRSRCTERVYRQGGRCGGEDRENRTVARFRFEVLIVRGCGIVLPALASPWSIKNDYAQSARFDEEAGIPPVHFI